MPSVYPVLRHLGEWKEKTYSFPSHFLFVFMSNCQFLGNSFLFHSFFPLNNVIYFPAISGLNNSSLQLWVRNLLEALDLFLPQCLTTPLIHLRNKGELGFAHVPDFTQNMPWIHYFSTFLQSKVHCLILQGHHDENQVSINIQVISSLNTILILDHFQIQLFFQRCCEHVEANHKHFQHQEFCCELSNRQTPDCILPFFNHI